MTRILLLAHTLLGACTEHERGDALPASLVTQSSADTRATYDLFGRISTGPATPVSPSSLPVA